MAQLPEFGPKNDGPDRAALDKLPSVITLHQNIPGYFNGSAIREVGGWYLPAKWGSQATSNTTALFAQAEATKGRGFQGPGGSRCEQRPKSFIPGEGETESISDRVACTHAPTQL